MDPAQWFASFRQLHDKARTRSLDDIDRNKYLAMREEFARSLMKAQGQSVADGRPARRQLRVAHLFQVEVANLYSTTTRELSCSGFTAVVQGALSEGQQIVWSIKASRVAEPVSGTARVTSVAKGAGGNYRVSCDFETLDEQRLESLEYAVFDAALSRVG